MFLRGVTVLELDRHPDHNKNWPTYLAQVFWPIPRTSMILTTLHSRQPTVWMHDLCQGVVTVHGNEWHMFWAKALPLLILTMSRIWHNSRRSAFNVFSYDELWADHRTHHLPDAERIYYVLCHVTGYILNTIQNLTL